jgi:acetyl-CoA/propionyl-CoA carboxylase biotin carboxyl carrier protein
MQGSEVSCHFDSLLAKLIVTGPTREIAIQRAKRALAAFEIEGVATVLPFHKAVLQHPDFVDEFKVHTRWIEQDFSHEYEVQQRSIIQDDYQFARFMIEIDGKLQQIGLPKEFLNFQTVQQHVKPIEEVKVFDEKTLLAPISGVITAWKVEDNQMVEKGDVVAVMEAMKMEVQVTAHRSGQIKQLAQIHQNYSNDEKIAEIHAV